MNFHILTYATDKKNPIYKILSRALPLIVVECDNFDWAGKNTSPVLIEFLNSLPDNDLVLYTDCYDVLPLNNCSYETLFESITKNFDLNKVTFNAESACHTGEETEHLYPPSPGKWKFLNGGIGTGLVKNFKNLLKIIVEKGITTNQKIYAKVFFDSNLIDLDYRCEVFQNLLPEVGAHPGHDIIVEDFIFKNKNIINKYFNTQPLLFHGSGQINLRKLLPYVRTISK